MTVVVATLLTGLRNLTAGQAEINEKVFNKRAILKSLADGLDGDLDVMTDEEVQAVFNDNVQQYSSLASFECHSLPYGKIVYPLSRFDAAQVVPQ